MLGRLLWMTLWAAGPLAAACAEESAGYRLPLLVGPQAAAWELLSGRVTHDADRVTLSGGTCVVLSGCRYSHCMLELDYCRLGPLPVEPVVYFHAERMDDQGVVCGPCVALPGGTGPGRSRRRPLGFGRRVPTVDRAWRHVRIAVADEGATLWSDGVCAGSVSSGGGRDGLLAIRIAGDAGSGVVFANLSVTETGCQALLNGVDLSGWEGAGADAERCWRVQDGLLQCTGQEGPWLRTRQQYGDFRLRLEYRLGEGGNSGVYLRVPRDGNHHGPGAGVEVQILDDASDRYRELEPYQFSASLYAIAAARRGSARPAGAWNALDIRCVGHHYTVTHNGQTVLDVSERDYPELAARLARGFIGLQNHSEPVWFRHLRIGAP